VRPRIKVAFASGTDELNVRLLERMRNVFPELPLYVVSEFPPAGHDLRWIRYDLGRGFDNLCRCRAEFRGKQIRLAGVLMVAKSPTPGMKLLALWLAPLYFLAINENLDDYMLRPRSLPAILRHMAWRTKNFLAFHRRRCTWHRSKIRMLEAAAGLCGRFRARTQTGGELLLPALEDRVLGVVPDAIPGVAQARNSHILLWNEKQAPSAEMVRKLMEAFVAVPDLFCASTQFRSLGNAPGSGTGLVYSLLGSGGALYDAAKLRALGGWPSRFRVADIAALDVSYRAWQQAWPTVFVPGASTGENIPKRGQLLTIRRHCEYLNFLVQSVGSRDTFQRLWREAMHRLRLAAAGQPGAVRLLGQACRMVFQVRCPAPPLRFPEDLFLALTDGNVSVFPGRPPAGKPRVVIASPYLPFPLSHGGAVRMYNLGQQAAADFDQILVVFSDRGEAPAAELLKAYVEVVVVRRQGTHAHPNARIPDAVQDFESAAFGAALRQAVRKWKASIVQMEFTQMAQYASNCAPARTVLVEHDITLDLYRQMATQNSDWDTCHQFRLWRRFERRAWDRVDVVVTMSEKDRAMVPRRSAVVLPNGVDLERFQKTAGQPERGRILFIGSFAHLPNVFAVEFFLREVWPLMKEARLHIIAGARHEYYLSHYRHRVNVDLDHSGLEVEDFVADVRPAYGRAAVVIAPLVVSAGTNLKTLEAMAMEKPVVSTPAGVNGLDLTPGEDFVLVHTAAEMAEAIKQLMENPSKCRRIGAAARRRVERQYSWDAIARRQGEMYRELLETKAVSPAFAAEQRRVRGLNHWPAGR
jgi:glycosyltransferase involved in cell wall biosynthesis